MSIPLKTLCVISLCLLSSLSAAGQNKVLDNIPVRPRLEPLARDIKQLDYFLSNDTIKICILGDVMLHSKQIKQALKKGADSLAHESYKFDCFDLIKDRIQAADLSIANMEFTLAGPAFTGYPCFSAPDSYASYIAECGVDVFLTANNHILDKGTKGAIRTIETYSKMQEDYGIRYTGSRIEQELDNNPLIVDIQGIKIAIVNLTYGTNRTLSKPYISYLSSMDLYFESAIKCEPDVIIALPHWGNEYQLNCSTKQINDAEKMAKKGADIIIGAHPHVVQNADKIEIEDKQIPVLYSLGNAVSNMSAPNTQLGLMAEVTIVKKLNNKTEVWPSKLTWLWCSRPGGYNDSYTVIPIEDYLYKKTNWKGAWDYENMVSTWTRVCEKTGLPKDGRID